MTEPLRQQASIDIAVPPDAAYEAVRHLERMGEWSPENRGGRWVDGDGSSVGDQFEGDNKRGELEWSFAVTVNAADPGTKFGFHTGPGEQPWVQWTYEFAPADGGCTVTESWELLQAEPFVQALGEDYPATRSAQMKDDLATTLSNLKTSLER